MTTETKQESLKVKIKVTIMLTMLMVASAKSEEAVENTINSMAETLALAIDKMYMSDTSEQPDQAKDTAVPAAA